MSKPLNDREGNAIGTVSTENGQIVLRLNPQPGNKPSASGKMFEVVNTKGFVQFGQIGGHPAKLNLYIGTQPEAKAA